LENIIVVERKSVEDHRLGPRKSLDSGKSGYGVKPSVHKKGNVVFERYLGGKRERFCPVDLFFEKFISSFRENEEQFLEDFLFDGIN